VTNKPHHALAVLALGQAFDALQAAATELTLAVALAPAGSAISCDALVLARAVELESVAVQEAVRRHY
jgi:hypothetical protein